VAVINRETKPCPKCTANIYKTEGCDDMYCTHCRTYFSWTSGRITRSNSNGHYLHLEQFARNVTVEDQDERTGCSGEGFSLNEDRIPLESVASMGFPKDLVGALYEDSNVVRLAKRIRYHHPTVHRETEEAYQKLQVSYLLGEIDYNHWSSRVYALHRKKQLSLLYSEILSLYLSTVDELQRKLYERRDPRAVRTELTNLIELCNASFDSIYEEYQQGARLHLRTVDDGPDVPVFTS
jgi:hypothetical protein